MYLDKEIKMIIMEKMIKVILFDLDGTLYKSSEVYQKFAEAAYFTYAKIKKTTIEEAKEVLEKRREEMKKEKGYAVPYTLALLEFGISIEQWHRENIAYFNAGDYLMKDEKLRGALIKLKEKCKLGVFTNNNRIQTERILKAIGVEEIFDYIFTYESFNLIKPDPEIFKLVVKRLNARPEECLMVGDRYYVDLVPAKEQGMQIYEVKGPEDIPNLLNIF
uniref:HAD family hydrolase n=1 Tax=candidate division WOR-3 bacterium TaxID=2052148 RepID=A0A7C4TD41_UNCW3